MSIAQTRHVHTHEGHRIEVVEDAVDKHVRLLIDGREVASESCIFPQEIRLEGALESEAIKATIEIRFLRGSVVSLEIDGKAVPLHEG